MKKNPYVELATLLRALPEGKRMLVSQYLTFNVGPEVCRCVFGALYPKTEELDADEPDLTEVYQLGEISVFDTREHQFYLWVKSLGGTYEFVEEVMSTNDYFNPYENTKVVCQDRYTYMLKWLDQRAEKWEASAP